MSRAAVDPEVADAQRRLDVVYAERYVNGRWDGLAKLLVKWTPELRAAQPIPPPAPNVIILDERVRQRRAAAAARDAARREEA